LLSVAALWAGAAVIGSIFTVANTLLAPQITMDVPVASFWPELPPSVTFEGTTATRTGGGFTTAALTITDVSVGARVLWAISQGLSTLVPGMIAALIALACFQLLAGRAFAPVVARMAMITAIVVAAGGSASQVLSDIAGSLASAELFSYTSGGWTEIPDIADPLRAWLPQATFGVTLPFWPFAAGFAFAALAAVFRYGSRLQHDTDGLV